MNIKLSGIELTYSYKKVLRGVNVEFLSGGIHALLGENGAGKSSLMKILTGFTKPTAGKIFLDEKEVHFKSPSDSLKTGIACVYQRPYLSDSLSVKDNLKIGIKKKNSDFSKVMEILSWAEIDSLDIKVKKLSGDQRFFAAFAGSLLRHPEVLILDEPTALLNETQSKLLFEKLRSLSDAGMNIILITHKSQDLQYCDDITYLVDGAISQGEYSNKSENISEACDEISFSSSKLNLKNCYQLRKEGAGVIPSDRTYLASDPNLTIIQLVCANYCEANPKKRYVHAVEIIERAGISIQPEEKAYNLSGGMLQRLILERELYGEPEVLYLEDPFQGLDSASVQKLSERLEQFEKDGRRVVFL